MIQSREGSPTVDDLCTVRSIVASAFADDPFMLWLFPDNGTRHDCVTALLGPFVEAYLAQGFVHVLTVDDRIQAAALWSLPHHPPIELPSHPAPLGLIAAVRGSFFADNVVDAYTLFEEVRPHEPYTYLHFLAVAPSSQGRGLGAALLQAGLQHRRIEGSLVHLETNSARTVPFYRTAGFDLVAHRHLPHSAPDLWALRRGPG